MVGMTADKNLRNKNRYLEEKNCEVSKTYEIWREQRA
jgi:hypothetical protein